MNTALQPRVDIFNPYVMSFSGSEKDKSSDDSVFSVQILRFIKSGVDDDHNQIVCKCTPCQCCACR